MKKIKLWSLSGLLLICFFVACSSEDKWKSHEQQQISDFISTIPDTAYILKPSGLYYFEIKAGTGRIPVQNNLVYFKYTGRFLNGVAFDSISTVSAPYEYLVGSMAIVSGVDEGLRYMKAGGKALLLTPSNLAYGREGIFNIIPGYTPLIWEIQLDSVVLR